MTIGFSAVPFAVREYVPSNAVVALTVV